MTQVSRKMLTIYSQKEDIFKKTGAVTDYISVFFRYNDFMQVWQMIFG